MFVNLQSHNLHLDANITVVIQGNCDVYTPAAVLSIRRAFPAAELILSTWEGCNVSGLEVDNVVFSPDPGAVFADEVVGVLNNVNRQLVSTQAGLQAATRPFILKTRTDIFIQDPGFLSYFGKYDEVPSPYFQNRLLICSYYTRNPRVFPTCFHPSDWLVFGRAADVRKYYEHIPLMTQEDGSWFRNHPKASTFFTNYICRFTPEQHIFINFLRQYQDITCNCYYDHTPPLIQETERAFASCFVVLGYQRQLEITFPKYDPNRYLEKHTLIAHWEWKALYHHYCKKIRSPLWLAYQLRNSAIRLWVKMRVICIRILDAVGIKETVKAFLSRRKSSGMS